MGCLPKQRRSLLSRLCVTATQSCTTIPDISHDRGNATSSRAHWSCVRPRPSHKTSHLTSREQTKKGAAQHFAHYDQCSCRGGGPFFVRACHWELSEGEAACSSLPCLLARQLRRMSNEVLTTLATPPAAAEATLTSTRRALSRSVKRTKRS